MARQDPRAVVVLIDNSLSSIDSDFIPNRLQAQIVATDRLVQYLFKVNKSSEVAVATLSSSEFGIRSSFTNVYSRIEECLQTITTGGPRILVVRGIKWSILALRHINDAGQKLQKRILMFVASENDVTEKAIPEVTKALKEEGIILDIVLFGSDVPNVDAVKQLVPPQHRNKSVVIQVPLSQTVLSDDVLASGIGPGPHIVKIDEA